MAQISSQIYTQLESLRLGVDYPRATAINYKQGVAGKAMAPTSTDPSALVAVIERFLYLNGPEHEYETKGRANLHATVTDLVSRQERIELVFPGFPFKSPSQNKVLGVLPDYADELLLRRLEFLAASIESVYSPGAVVRIVSDGVVYGAILGRTDSAVYEYNAELRRLCKELGLTHISFVRLIDLFDEPGQTLSSHDQTREEYLETAPQARKKLTEMEVPGWDLATKLKNDYGVLMTYRGYLKFLISDLEDSHLLKSDNGKPLPRSRAEKVRSRIAKEMLECGSRFSLLIEKRFPDVVRLSCHLHKQSGPKFGIELFPGHTMNASPWHNTILEKSDGSFTIGSYKSFKCIDHVVVERYGRPYFLRELSHTIKPGCDAHVSSDEDSDGMDQSSP